LILLSLLKKLEKSSVLKNCLFYCAYSEELQNKHLQKQAKKLIEELFSDNRVGQRAADLDLSGYQSLNRLKGERGF